MAGMFKIIFCMYFCPVVCEASSISISRNLFIYKKIIFDLIFSQIFSLTHYQYFKLISISEFKFHFLIIAKIIQYEESQDFHLNHLILNYECTN